VSSKKTKDKPIYDFKRGTFSTGPINLGYVLENSDKFFNISHKELQAESEETINEFDKHFKQ